MGMSTRRKRGGQADGAGTPTAIRAGSSGSATVGRAPRPKAKETKSTGNRKTTRLDDLALAPAKTSERTKITRPTKRRMTTTKATEKIPATKVDRATRRPEKIPARDRKANSAEDHLQHATAATGRMTTTKAVRKRDRSIGRPDKIPCTDKEAEELVQLARPTTVGKPEIIMFNYF